ncbi:MAG: hypothetical protein K8S27_14215 [Candidatus Omnitrophica bacterium]|nr:hypothetical protein [Candidatus Omnitrophota bacterium]
MKKIVILLLLSWILAYPNILNAQNAEFLRTTVKSFPNATSNQTIRQSAKNLNQDENENILRKRIIIDKTHDEKNKQNRIFTVNTFQSKFIVVHKFASISI